MVTQGLTGRSERGWPINITYLIPTSGTMTASQFAEWAMLSDDSNPNHYTLGQQKILSSIEARFKNLFGSEPVECGQFHDFLDSRDG